MGRHRVIGGSPPVALSFRSGTTFAGVGNPHTVVAADIGAAAANRSVVIAVWTTSAEVTAVTIGGVSASLIHSSGHLRFFGSLVPTGATGNIVLSGGGLLGNIALAVWAAYNLKSLTAIDTSTNTTTVAGDTLTSKPRGCAFAMALDGCVFDEFPSAFSISGMTLNAQPTMLGPPNYRFMFASALTPSTTLAYSTAPIANSTGFNDQIISVSLR